MTPLRSDELLALPVCLHGIQLGRPVDLLLDRTDVLLEEDELAFYQARAFGLTSLRGTPVDRAGRHKGRLKDIAFLADGALTELVLEDDGGETRLPFDDGLRIATGSRSVA